MSEIADAGSKRHDRAWIAIAVLVLMVFAASMGLYPISIAAFLAAEGGAAIRALEGRQAVAFAPAYDDPRIAADPVIAGFRAQLPFTVLTSNRPEMRAVW